MSDEFKRVLLLSDYGSLELAREVGKDLKKRGMSFIQRFL